MSSTDQAFVKAFARRNRAGSRNSDERIPSLQQHSPPPSPMLPPSNPEESSDETVQVIREPGSLQVDRSVASTAQVWVDPIEDSIARADEGAAGLPRPHVETGQPSQRPINDVEPSQRDVPTNVMGTEAFAHIHTAYATPLAETPLAPPERTTFSMPIPAPHAPIPAPLAPIQAPHAPVQAPHAPVQAPHAPMPAPTQIPGVDVAPAPSPNQVEAKIELRVDPPSAVGPMAHIPFQAVWEVDVFDIPHVVADLFFEGALFQQIAERMSEAVSSGLNTVLVTSMHTGEGRSSVAIGMAMAAAAAGIRVALIDADTQDPTLADDLRLDLRSGWVDAIRGGMPIKEVAVAAVEDGVTLIPLMPPHGHSSATESELVEVMDLLKHKFELVIIDGPAGTSRCLGACASSVDSAIIVRDTTRTSALEIGEFSRRLQGSGVTGVGVVENFV